MAINEEKIRKRILDVIWTMFPESKKIRRNPFTSDRSEWSGHFTHKILVGGVQANVTLAFVVRRAGFKPAVKSGTTQHTFEILGFEGYQPGTDADNSEDRFQQRITALAERLSDNDTENPVWEFEDEADEITTESVDFRTIGLIQAGGFLHYGGGRLIVNYHPC